MSIPVFRPSIKRKDMDSVLSCMVSDQLWPGQQNEELITALLELLDADGGAALREPVTAYKAVFHALSLEDRPKVALSVLSSVSLYRAVCESGLEPVFLDVDQGSGLVEEQVLKDLAQDPSIGALIVNTPLGFVPSYEVLRDLSIPIIEDISEGIGGRYTEDVPVGGIGDFIMIGMEPEDVITAGGGMVVLSRGKKQTKALTDAVSDLPQELYLSDMSAALGRTQVKELKGFIEKRRELFETYIRASMRSHHSTLHQPGEALYVPYGFPVVVRGGMNEPIQYARKKGVETQPAYLHSIYQLLAEKEVLSEEEKETLPRKFPGASALQLSTLLFPLYPALTGKEFDIIQKVLVTLP